MITTAALFIMFVTSNARTVYGGSIDVNVFYGALEPYGEWIEVGYDDYVWRPYKADYNWRPYSEGRWEWTRHGWYWVSYEPFGWATFHYGRWYHDDYYGWVWMPDNVWAPAWVEWRYNDYYIGWSPLPPYARFHYDYGIRFSIKWHSNHVYWNFVRYNHFVSHRVYNHYVDRYYVKNIYRKTKYRTNYFRDNNRIVNGGISRRYVERKAGRKLTTRKISRTENYKEYNSRDIKSRRGIVEYTPSERRINSSTFDKKSVKKGRALKSLNNDKVVINRRSNKSEVKGIDANNTREPKVNRHKGNNTRGNWEYDLPKSNQQNRDIANSRNKSEKKDIRRKSEQKSENKFYHKSPSKNKQSSSKFKKESRKRVEKKSYSKKGNKSSVKPKSGTKRSKKEVSKKGSGSKSKSYNSKPKKKSENSRSVKSSRNKHKA